MAGVELATAYVSLTVSGRGISQEVQRELGAPVEKEAATAGKAAGSNFARTFAQGVAAIGLGRALIGSLGEANEAIKVAAQTEAAIRSTGGAANVTAAEIADLSGELSDLNAVDDDIIQQSANLLLTFRNVRNEVGEGNDIFNIATATLQDMAAALGGDASDSAIQLGKALNDPVAGISALTRVGVTFTAQQKEQIRTLAESGDILSAQKIILEELAAEFGGSAAAQATGLDRITVATGELKEAIGNSLVPAVDLLAPIVKSAVEVFDDLPTPVQAATVAIAGIGVAAQPVLEVINTFRGLAASSQLAAAATALSTTATTANTVAVAGQTVAYNSATAVMGLYTGATLRARLATSALGTSLGVAAAIGAPLAVFTAASRDAAAGVDQARSVIDDFVTRGDFNPDTSGFEDFTNEIARVNQAGATLAEEFDNTGVFEGQLRGRINAGIDALNQYGQTLEVTADEVAALAAEEGISNEAAYNIIRARQEQEQAYTGLTTTIGLTATAVQRLGDVQQSYIDRTHAQFDTGLALELALLNTADALAGADAAFAEFGPGSEEAARAYNAALQTASDQADLAVADAEARNGAIELSDQQRARIQIDSLLSVADNLDPSSEIRRRLDEYIFALASIPSRMDTALFLEVFGINPDFGQGTEPMVRIGAHAAGGSASRGDVSWVGELGPELVLWGADAHVLPADVSAAVASGGGDRTNRPINIINPVSIEDASRHLDRVLALSV